MRMQAGFALILLLISSESLGQNVSLYGSEKEYAGMHVPVEFIFNPLTGNTRILDTLKIDEHGNFKLGLQLQEITWIRMELGIYECSMLLNPGFSYNVSFPLRRDKTEEEIRNPFFLPMPFHLQVKESREMTGNSVIPKNRELNSRIFRFDTMMYRINTDQLLARQENKSYPVDSLISTIENAYLADSSVYFRKYRKYRYGLAQVNGADKSLSYIYSNYLESEYPELKNPAYLDLFNKMYEKFFYYFSRTDDGKGLNQIINLEHDLLALRNKLRKHSSIPCDTIADLVILKEVSESYYRDLYYKKALLIILDSLKADPSMTENTIYAEDIYQQLTKLMIGSKAPVFTLPDQDGEMTSIEEFEGKYVFIMFCTPDNYSCMKEYPFLKALHAKHDRYLEVITVMVCDSIEVMRDFNTNNDYTWTSLFYGNNDKILDLYSIRVYPTCYLIGPDGQLIQSPATLPTEGFEQQLFRIMRSRGDL